MMNIANQLTLLRLFLIPVFVGVLYLIDPAVSISFMAQQIPLAHFLAAIIFALASVTDYLDGYLARKYHLVTSFGAFFDPMADKLLVMAAFVALVSMQKVPAWICIIILGRELLVTGLRVLLAQHDGKVMAAAMPGKIKTFTQMFAIIFFLMDDFGLNQLPFSIAKLLLYVCLFFTIYSGIEYFYQGRFVFYNK
ncbi:CDP-diacylglycerol--glycerol-3-phosphate 3-phosphatidyltransferase [Ignavigranum ruoffiae]|uniref:CDP-diacylglycerol--glycerol-3-phosphate 3-phosphatidyltransferase n=2 Tax=Ignavigranum ruoffiae TaxID=89093 RepID=A0A1H8ZPH2_9LACT|nr:CDP-diacylglycerol--glycerol-3-phosphate 3-phosphatidyltransferase [Ignavigranum ruoffiae]